MGRILVIRGGAIGDFVLTLPALKLLREAFPRAHLEILGYRHIVALAAGRSYANATRSIEYSGLASFFARGAELPPDLVEYFASFHQVISYLFDPDEIFAGNLKLAGVRHLLTGSPKIHGGEHAASQLARPLEQLALYLDDPAAAIFPSEQDCAHVANAAPPFIALHPGSGGERKNWPVERWRELIVRLLSQDRSLLIISGEADQKRLATLRSALRDPRVFFADQRPLPQLAALLQRATAFIGHDSGVSHIAAAVGTPCILLFGPTNPDVWAPANRGVRVIRALDGEIVSISLESVRYELMRIGIST